MSGPPVLNWYGPSPTTSNQGSSEENESSSTPTATMLPPLPGARSVEEVLAGAATGAAALEALSAAVQIAIINGVPAFFDKGEELSADRLGVYLTQGKVRTTFTAALAEFRAMAPANRLNLAFAKPDGPLHKMLWNDARPQVSGTVLEWLASGGKPARAAGAPPRVRKAKPEAPAAAPAAGPAAGPPAKKARIADAPGGVEALFARGITSPAELRSAMLASGAPGFARLVVRVAADLLQLNTVEPADPADPFEALLLGEGLIKKDDCTPLISPAALATATTVAADPLLSAVLARVQGERGDAAADAHVDACVKHLTNGKARGA